MEHEGNNSKDFAEIFHLLDLPWELTEQIVGELNSRALIQLGMTSHQFKELASMAHYWHGGYFFQLR